MLPMAINQEMPEDMLIHILSRLPVKSLIRFKSVSKYLYSLIQNPSFISLHNNRSQKNNSLLAIRYPKPDYKIALSLVSNGTPIHDLYEPFSCPQVGGLYVIGSSNGIVCLKSYSSEIVLWNPAMREFRILPRRPYHTRHTSNLGFAFDPKTNDYNVLRIASLFEYNPRTPVCECVDKRVQIYHMSTDSWREIVAMVPKDILICRHHHHSTWLDGVFYWVAANPHGRSKIAAFHMSNELSEQVFLPEDIKIDSLSCLCFLRDALALFTSDGYKVETEWSLGIWVRDGNRVKDPWNKKYSFGPILGCYATFGILRNGELLLRGNGCWMVSYNLDTQIIREYSEPYDVSGSIYQYPVLPYAENLVSFKRRVSMIDQFSLQG